MDDIKKLEEDEQVAKEHHDVECGHRDRRLAEIAAEKDHTDDLAQQEQEFEEINKAVEAKEAEQRTKLVKRLAEPVPVWKDQIEDMHKQSLCASEQQESYHLPSGHVMHERGTSLIIPRQHPVTQQSVFIQLQEEFGDRYAPELIEQSAAMLAA